MTGFFTDYSTAVWGLVSGLWWLWAFIGLVLVSSLAVSGGIGLLIACDHLYTRRQVRRGLQRVVNPNTGREQWVPVADSTRAAFERTASEINSLPEVRRG